MSGVRCSWWEPTGIRWHELHVECKCGHKTIVPLGANREDSVDWDTAPWPVHCAGCGAEFDYAADAELWKSSSHAWEMRCPATGEVLQSATELPPGALYDIRERHASYRPGPDGRGLVCVLPDGHHWHIDARASNCTMPEDTRHRCWCRHGDPVAAAVTVDKDCESCAAGAGSIQSGGWHGFLRAGYLVQ